MRAMLLEKTKEPLRLADVPVPEPGPGQVRVKIQACGVCRTDLHIVDGELPPHKRPVIIGHQIVGAVDKVGPEGDQAHTEQPVRESPTEAPPAPGGAGEAASSPPETAFGSCAPALGDLVGIPWLGYTDGTCPYCRSGRENLCDHPKFTGYDIDGGFAEYTVADHRYAFPIPAGYPVPQAAPLLCAGLIGYRSLSMCGDAERLGLYGYGAAAHIVTQVARHQGRRVFAFTRPGDGASQQFARDMGSVWAGGTDEHPHERLDAAIIFAPVGNLVPLALRAVAKGGVVVCGGIHMSDIPSFSYDDLWGERVIRSVANLTRRDGQEFLSLAPRVPVHTEVELFPLENANEALEHLRSGHIRGAAVLMIERG
jgi:propanol-preferring alcohol dehydrogenase